MRLLSLLAFVLIPRLLLGGGVRGKVTTKAGEALPYAAIVVKGTTLGTITNNDGYYELQLEPGSYEVYFQFLGFKAISKKLVIKEAFEQVDVVLEEQVLNLSTVNVGKDKEDPAYSVMRRAIAKSRFHQLQVRGYTARAYTKSTGVITNIPFLLEGRLKKEGIVENKALLNEAVAEITYRRPNTFNQRILSTRNNFDNSAPSPNEYILASFYSPEVANTVSPLSPRAFAYYKFEYEGFFEENGQVVNKIKVIPRSYGQGVFKGSIYILEDSWAIHSLDLNTLFQGLSINVRQVFSPLQGVWLPLNQYFKIGGSYLGFSGNFNYVVSLKYSKLDVDPNLKDEIVIKDHKKEEVATAGPTRKANLEKMIQDQKEFSTKNFRKLVKEYDKEAKKERKQAGEDTRVVRNDSITIDSLANKRDSTFWSSIRPVPLTLVEKDSYHWQDSIKVMRQATAKRDSIRNDSTTFRLSHVLTGKTYRFAGRNYLTLETPLQSLAYNTVETYVFDFSLGWNKRWKNDQWLNIKPVGRYSFGRNRLSGSLQTGYGNRKWNLSLEGGEYIYQYNLNAPISPGLNTVTTTLFEQNFMKLYQKQFIKAGYHGMRLSDIMSFSVGTQYAWRTDLDNKEGVKPWINWKKREFTSNWPDSSNLKPQNATHQAMIFSLNVRLRPWQKYSIRNGRKNYWGNSGPTFLIGYEKGLPWMGSEVDFDLVQTSIRHNFNTGPRSSLQVSVNAGAFLNSKKVYFQDFKHFMGNEFFFQAGDALTSFRMLPYYRYSTSSRFVQAHLLWSTQKLLVSQITPVRLLGIRESFQVHYLATPASKNYSELVYSIDGILRLFRVELVGQFQDFRYQKPGVRIGTVINIR